MWKYDCFTCIYSFCYHTKEISGCKLVHQLSSYCLAFPIFSQTNSWDHFLRILNITNSEFFTYESIKAYINSLLPKIDELQYIGKLSEAADIGISESKLDDLIISSKIQIENYDIVLIGIDMEVVLLVS